MGAAPLRLQDLWLARSEERGGWAPTCAGWRGDPVRAAFVYDDQYALNGSLVRPGEVYGDITVEAGIQITKTYWPDWAGLLIRSGHPLAYNSWRDGYLIRFFSTGRVQVVVVNNKILADAEFGLDFRSARVAVTVSMIGNGLRVCADGRCIVELEDDAHPYGEIALTGLSNKTVFSDVRITGKQQEPGAPSPGRRVFSIPSLSKDQPVKPLPRLGVQRERGRPGALCVRATGQRFVPQGYNDAVGGLGGGHGVFNVGVYDPERTKAALRGMREAGANAIRLWVWGEDYAGTGLAGPEYSTGLNREYMENVADFLRRANHHGIYALPIVDEIPFNRGYDEIERAATPPDDDKSITGYNRRYLSPGPIAAKQAALRDFIRCIRDTDPGLLNGVLAWQIVNEAYVKSLEGPFARSSGVVKTANGNCYDMADPDQRQACWDDGIVHWSNEMAKVIRDEDPEGLVAVGMWDARAAKRENYHGLMHPHPDPRFPSRPAVIARDDCQVDVLDIHIYPFEGVAPVDPRFIDWGLVTASGKPAILGEYGAFFPKNDKGEFVAIPTDPAVTAGEKSRALALAHEQVSAILREAYAIGFAGDLFWSWDLRHAICPLYTAQDEGFNELVQAIRRPLRASSA